MSTAEIAVTALRRLEVWSDSAAAGGTRLAFIPDVLEAADDRELEGDEVVTFVLPLVGPGIGTIAEKRVLRTVWQDLSWEEWRVERHEKERREDGALVLRVEAVAMIFDLAHGRVQAVQANGQVDMDFDLTLLPEEHVDLVLASPNIAAHFVRGTIGSTDPIQIGYAGDTPLGALRAIAAAAEHELYVDRDDDGIYHIHMVEEIGAAAPVARLHYARNIRSIQRRIDTALLATRVYPRGGEVDGFALGIAGALWEVAAIAGAKVQLLDFPIAFARQLDGLQARVYGSAVDREVTETFPDTQEVELADLSGIAVGDLIQFRDPDGNELVYLDRPDSIDAWGLWSPPDAVEASDIPPVDNLVRNAFLDEWPADVLAYWAAVGGAVISRETDALFHRYGIASAKIEGAADGDGLQSDWFAVAPTAERPHFTAQLAFWIAEGGVRLELDVDTGSEIITLPDDGSTADSSEIGLWIESLAMNADLDELGAQRVRMRLVQHGATPTTVYLDAAQLTQTAGGAVELYDRRASNALWHRGNRHLAEFGAPHAEYDVDAVDLHRLDPTAFPSDELALGGTVIVEDQEMDATVRARVVRAARVLVGNVGVTQVRVSNLPPALVRLLQLERARRGRRLPLPEDDAVVDPTLYAMSVTEVEKTPTTTTLKVIAGPGIVRIVYWHALVEDPQDYQSEGPLPEDMGEPHGVLDASRELTVPYPPPTHKRYVRFSGYASEASGALPVNTIDVGINPHVAGTPGPQITSAIVVGTKIQVTAINNRSLRVEHADTGWVQAVNAKYHEFDLSQTGQPPESAAGIGTFDTWLVTITASDEPVGSMIQGAEDSVNRVVKGLGATLPDPPYVTQIIIDGTKVAVSGNVPQTKSLRIQRLQGGVPDGWVTHINGTFHQFDLADDDDDGLPGIGASDTWQVEIVASDLPKGAEGTEMTDRHIRTVSGGSATEPEWIKAVMTPPAVSSDTASLTLHASDDPTDYYVKVWRQFTFGSGFGAWADVTAELDPVPTDPPTTETQYDVPDLETRISSGIFFVTYRHRVEILNGDDEVVATKTIEISYRFTPPVVAPDEPSWVAVTATGPSTVGQANIDLSMRADATPSGYYVRVWRRSRNEAVGPLWSAPIEKTALFGSPPIEVPTTDLPGADTGFVMAPFGDLQEYEYRFDLHNASDAVIETTTRLVQYYTGTQVEPE